MALAICCSPLVGKPSTPGGAHERVVVVEGPRECPRSRSTPVDGAVLERLVGTTRDADLGRGREAEVARGAAEAVVVGADAAVDVGAGAGDLADHATLETLASAAGHRLHRRRPGRRVRRRAACLGVGLGETAVDHDQPRESDQNMSPLANFWRAPPFRANSWLVGKSLPAVSPKVAVLGQEGAAHRPRTGGRRGAVDDSALELLPGAAG